MAATSNFTIGRLRVFHESVTQPLRGVAVAGFNFTDPADRVLVTPELAPVPGPQESSQLWSAEQLR